MCHKPSRSEPERRPEQARPQPEPRPLGTWENTRPRGNPDPHRKDVERSVERLEMLLGR